MTDSSNVEKTPLLKDFLNSASYSFNAQLEKARCFSEDDRSPHSHNLYFKIGCKKVKRSWGFISLQQHGDSIKQFSSAI